VGLTPGRAFFSPGSTELAEVLPHQGPYTTDRLG
jgi:hypothetical protein